MSAPATDGPAVPGGSQRGLSKIVLRLKTVLKRRDGSGRLSFAGKPAPVATAGLSVLAQPADPTPVIEASTPATKVPAPVADPEPVGDIPKGPQPTRMMRSQIEADRAMRIRERFAVTIEPLPSASDREICRVAKPIRMRIHRTCHQCETTFGANKVCSQCQHARCKSCPRYPPKKTDKGKWEKAQKKENVTPSIVVYIEPDTYWGLREQILLTKPSPRPGAQPLVRKKPKQRVRRNCHECGTLFPGGCKICPNCDHLRCVDCPRDPAKRSHYPDGYPGDAPSSNTSLPIKYRCHKCTKVFPAVPHPDSAEGIARKEGKIEPPECVRCKHPMCSACPRAPPVRIDPEPDPDVLRSVQAKLAALRLTV
ncbi:hypothetical protein LZ554_003436 [Drepanopeziza brunnea f. sp. 'monogermtubi']|nr:hypothetical protein LZ554_003436 [Drepanopeziza brunnea f. sp. 'monogermtubi']